VKEITI